MPGKSKRGQGRIEKRKLMTNAVNRLPEPCAWRHARTVLRGLGLSNEVWLPDHRLSTWVWKGPMPGWASTESPSPYGRGVAGNGWVSSRP